MLFEEDSLSILAFRFLIAGIFIGKANIPEEL